MVVLLTEAVDSPEGLVIRGEVGMVYGHRGNLELVEFRSATKGDRFIEVDASQLQRAIARGMREPR